MKSDKPAWVAGRVRESTDGLKGRKLSGEAKSVQQMRLREAIRKEQERREREGR